MVSMTAAIVAHRQLNLLWQTDNIGDSLFDWHFLDARFGDCVIQVVDVRLMVLAMVNFHRTCIEMRLKGIVLIGQLGQGIRHDVFLFEFRKRFVANEGGLEVSLRSVPLFENINQALGQA